MKPRSPRFPFIPLEEAVDLLRKLDAFQADRSQALKRPEILKALDYASLHGAAVKTIGAMRAYDLLQKSENGLSISPVGASILDADSDEQRREFLQRAALSPLMFRRIWRNARHSKRSELRELLLSRGFTEPGAKRASRIYCQNDELAGLQTLELEPELPPRGEGKGGHQGGPGQRRGNRGNGPGGRGPGDRGPANPNMLRLPLSSGTAVIPKGITQAEFQLLMQTLRTWKDQLVTPS